MFLLSERPEDLKMGDKPAPELPRVDTARAFPGLLCGHGGFENQHLVLCPWHRGRASGERTLPTLDIWSFLLLKPLSLGCGDEMALELSVLHKDKSIPTHAHISGTFPCHPPRFPPQSHCQQRQPLVQNH